MNDFNPSLLPHHSIGGEKGDEVSESNEKIVQQLAELKGRIDELSQQKKEPTKKSWIDILSSLSPIISGVIIATVGTAATIWYNSRQMHINHLNSLDKYRTYVISENPVERTFGYRAFVDLGEEEFVIELISANNDSAGINILTTIANKSDAKGVSPQKQKAASAANQLMATALMPEQRVIPAAILATREEASEEGWAYLGHYVASEKNWKTRYFDFPAIWSPQELNDKTLLVREETGSLNVRVGMPTMTGKFLEVKDALKPGSKAHVQEIKEWHSTGYMWAKISYGK